MARVKLSEYRTKKLLTDYLQQSYIGCCIDSTQNIAQQITSLDRDKHYVVKVDQGIKKRFKSGLIKLDVGWDEIEKSAKELRKSGYTRFIVEPFLKYTLEVEKYLSIQRERDGYLVQYSDQGGVDVEEKRDRIYSIILSYEDFEKQIKSDSELKKHITWLPQLIRSFDAYYFSFLEINPLLIIDDKPVFLDAACEVDDAGEFFVQGAWKSSDLVSHIGNVVEEVENVRILAEGSQASLKLDLFNPDGSLFLLLSGGGASIVLADQLYDLGYGAKIANYGEYSGNPNDEETYTYAKNVFSLLLKSKSKKKAVVIAGGVANFTDIRKTFSGIVRAMSEHAEALRKQKVKVFVRRGGPFQKEGLSAMKVFLEKEGLLGEVCGPEMVLTDIVKDAATYVNA